MIASKPWVNSLNISPEVFRSWYNQIPNNESITFWCLKNKKIDPKKYLNWAKNYYGLCSLVEGFFSKPIDLNTWDQLKTVANWSPSMIPVAFWENTIYIACVEPVEKTPWSFNIQYVLAPADQLQRYWDNLQALSQNKTQTENLVTISVNTPPPHPDNSFDDMTTDTNISPPNEDSNVISLPPPVRNDQNTQTDHDAVKSQKHELKFEDMQMPPVAEFDGPEGLQKASADFDVNLDDDKAASSLLQKTSHTDGPEGLNFNITDFKLDSLDNLVPAKDDNSEEINMPEGLKLKTPEMPPVYLDEESILKFKDPDNNGASQENVFAMPGLQDQKATENDKDNLAQPGLPKTPPPKAPSPSAINISQEDPFAKGKVSRVINDLSEAKNEKDVASFFFEHLRQEYTQCMLLLINGNAVTPWIWDASWRPKGTEALLPVSTNEASVFKIVVRTKLPYHGYVVVNDTNNRFFENWGLNSPPECLTICPLKQGGHIFGMLLCIGSKDKSTAPVLAFAEKINDQIIDEINRHSMAA